MTTSSLRPAAHAFDAIAPMFDSRFGAWQSVAAQRRAVRTALLHRFAPGSHLIEIGGGTGEDAAFLAKRSYTVLLTDPSPMMVQRAAEKLAPLGSSAEIVAGEEMESFAATYLANGCPPFDGAFSNFAPLNCIAELRPFARGLATLLRPGAAAMLVLFGTLNPGEMIIELLRGRPGQALRRFKRGLVPARLAKRNFEITYHRSAEILESFSPWFVLEKRVGIGIAVPPSAAEPWISCHPRLLAGMEIFDRIFSGTLPMLGDHVLYQFRRHVK